MSADSIKLTRSARRVLVEAHEFAVERAHAYIGPEHLLVGLLREELGLAARVLLASGADPEHFAQLATAMAPPAPAGGQPAAVVPSPGLKSILRKAQRLATDRDESLVGTEHMLLSLVEPPQGSAMILLRSAGFDPQAVRRALLEALGEQAEQLPTPEQKTGFVFRERYQIEELIGEGQLSRVYRAQDLSFQEVVKWVAIKELSPPADDPSVRETLAESFLKEARLLSALRHPFIPRFYDFFGYENRFYLVMEYIEGQDLGSILAESTSILPLERVMKWGLQLCQVLGYLHTQDPRPIVFRDLKPANVMVDLQDNVRLVDFNIARAVTVTERPSRVGTEGYSPPEQYHGDIIPMSDLYALGATLHHILTGVDPSGEPPFSFEDRPIRQYNPEVPAGIEQVISRSLAYNPEERFSSAQAMRQALERAMNAAGVAAE
jgi:tRNA A-37 threonylcarbamoyl transferase component Bud32